MKTLAVLTMCLCLAPHLVAAADGDDDVYEEGAIKYHHYETPAGSEWKEQALVLPPYPQEKRLIPVDVGRYDYPYRVLIDSASLSVGKDRLIRYTVVLRSESGVDNVSFEGVQCPGRKYKRYAYGESGRFHILPEKKWAFIRSSRQDIYRAVLAEDYFCPLPIGDPATEIRKKLKSSIGLGDGGDRYQFSGDEE